MAEDLEQTTPAATTPTENPIDAKIRRLQEQIAELEEQEDGDPLAKMFRGYKLQYDLDQLQNNQTDGLSNLVFGQKGLTPFLQGARSVKPEDTIMPAYKTIDPTLMNTNQMRNARDYNAKLKEMSVSRPFVNVASKGLGMWLGSAYGLGGALTGATLGSIVPMAHDWWQRRKATNYANEQEQKRMYMPRRLWGQ